METDEKKSERHERADRMRRMLLALQRAVISCFEAFEERVGSPARFVQETWSRPEGGGGQSCVLAAGQIFEKAGVNFSEVRGAALPSSAAARKPELTGLPWSALGVSVVVHPLNPHVPTSHMNVRFFEAETRSEAQGWWIGGGFDLTPYYPHWQDVLYWHQCAREVCARLDEGAYGRFKAWCDRYFFLPHRQETRGVGGIFFDDVEADGNFEQALAFLEAVGRAYASAYREIVERRYRQPWTDEERRWQLHRRGRYVEFNLLYDRGTHFGLQSGGRTESILMSLPPEVCWTYNYQPPGPREAEVLREFFRPRSWLEEEEAR